MSGLHAGSPHLSFYDYANMVQTNTSADNRYWTHLVSEIDADVREQESFD